MFQKFVFSDEISQIQDISKNKIDVSSISKDLGSYKYDINKSFEHQTGDIKKIIDAISYIHKNADTVYKGIKEKCTVPYLYNSRENYIIQYGTYWMGNLNPFNNTTKSTELNMESLMERLHNDEPLGIGFYSHGQASGHVVLAYKYEIISENELKIYVADSNFPINNSNTEYAKIYNRELENNDYIVFKKVNGIWQFKYEPNILQTRYKGVYNSYIPDTYLFIF